MQRAGEQFRSRREQFTTQIRRQNRQQILAKRRNILIENQKQKKQQSISNVIPTKLQTETTSSNLPETNAQINTKSKYHVIDGRFQKEIQQFQKVNVYKQPFLNFVTAIHDPDILKQHYGIIGIKKILTISNKPPIQQVVDSGLIPRLIQYAKQTEYPQLQLEAVWCLTNVASGNNSQTGPIIEKGGIKIFVDLLLSVHVGIVEQAIWVLGNIARDSSNYRDKIIKEGGLKNLIKLIELAIGQLQSNQGVRQIIESATWTLSGICQTPPIPAFIQIREALALFEYVIKNNLISDISIVGNICYAISNYVNNTKETNKKIDKIQQCINSGVVPKIVEYLEHPYDSLVIACLKIVGNIASGNFDQSKYLMSLNILPKLERLLQKNKKIIRRETCWVLSNLTAGSMQQIQAVFSQQNLVTKLIQMMKQDQFTVRSEICFIFANSTEYGDAAKIAHFLDELQYMKILVENLYSEDKDLIYSVLECIEIMLYFGSKNSGGAKKSIYVTQLHKLKAVARLQDLQYHDEDKIYEIVAKIIPKFFDLEDPLKL